MSKPSSTPSIPTYFRFLDHTCIVTGDDCPAGSTQGGVGKSSLLRVLHIGIFPEEAIVFEKGHLLFKHGKGQVTFKVHNTKNQDDAKRAATYAEAKPSVVLLCMQLSLPSSVKSVKTKWLPDIQKHAPGVPIILVGTKSDDRFDDTKKHIIKKEKAEELAQEIGAVAYLEVSAKTKHGIPQLSSEMLARSTLYRIETLVDEDTKAYYKWYDPDWTPGAPAVTPAPSATIKSSSSSSSSIPAAAKPIPPIIPRNVSPEEAAAEKELIALVAQMRITVNRIGPLSDGYASLIRTFDTIEARHSNPNYLDSDNDAQKLLGMLKRDAEKLERILKE